jgi:hypothetical protein
MLAARIAAMLCRPRWTIPHLRFVKAGKHQVIMIGWFCSRCYRITSFDYFSAQRPTNKALEKSRIRVNYALAY